MGKGIITNRSAAGLRRSVVAQRLRLREEWSSLKGTNDNEPSTQAKKKRTGTLSKNLCHISGIQKITNQTKTNYNSYSRKNKENSQPQSTNDTLRGVVALVDVGTESRALALRAALSALGATVVSAWSPLVTHLVWSQGGCRDTRAQARALACRVVSPLWVEACAASARRISEKVFPSTARDSDLPSPATLCRLLKQAERENWLVPELHSDSEDEGRRIRLRISSDTDDSTKESSKRNSTKETTNLEIQVNTAKRRALPISISPAPANAKSRRKLFTARAEGEEDSDAENTPTRVKETNTRTKKALRHNQVSNRPETAPERQKKVKKYNLTQLQKKNLENAERLARRLAADPATSRKADGAQTQRRSHAPRIVLSGMPRSQYQAVFTAIQTLKGVVQKQVNYQTTHVLLGSCKEDPKDNEVNTDQHKTTVISDKPSKQSQNQLSTNKTPVKPFSICNQCNSPEGLVMKMFECDNVEVTDHCSNPTNARDKDVTIICSTVNRNANGDEINDDVSEVHNHNVSDVIVNDKRLRTRKTLLGAARGCRVLHAQWALDSLKENKWISHIGYEVTHLLKTAQKARVERSAIGKMNADYGYNVFRRMRVSVTETADQRDAALQLLSLCGAEILSEADIYNYYAQNADKTTQNARTQYGGCTQDGGLLHNGAKFDSPNIVVIGKADDEVTSKWVFDSVAAGRPRTIRRYVNKNIS